MPYDPENAHEFREILGKLNKTYGLNTKKLEDLFVFEVKKRGSSTPNPRLSRSSLDRFIGGVDLPAKSVELGILYDALAGAANFQKFFPTPKTQNDEPDEPPEVTLAKSLARFFVSNNRKGHLYDIESLTKTLVGKYVMYRRDCRPRSPKGFALISIMHITGNGDYLFIKEVQDYKKSRKNGPYKQTDSGVMFPHGRYVYYIMKEHAGTCVKYATIDTLMTNDNEESIEWFQGLVFASSNLAMFPSAKFFCRRIREGDNYVSQIIKMIDIEDDEAKAYIDEL